MDIELLYDKIVNRNSKTTTFRVRFKLINLDREFYWSISIHNNKIKSILSETVIVDKSILESLKDELKYHSFSEVRYSANFNKNNIEFYYHEL